jgi:methyltransferase OMS1
MMMMMLPSSSSSPSSSSKKQLSTMKRNLVSSTARIYFRRRGSTVGGSTAFRRSFFLRDESRYDHQVDDDDDDVVIGDDYDAHTSTAKGRNQAVITRREGVVKTGALVASTAAVAAAAFVLLETKNSSESAFAKENDDEEKKMKENYDAYSQTYDDLDGNKIVVETLGIDQLRTKMFERVEGDVLELAVGTGLNLPYYKRVKSLTAIDLSPGMLEKAEEKFRGLDRNIIDGSDSANTNVKFEVANVESLPYEDETFDYVVDTFSMCVFEKPDVALREAKRVLKKGGKLLLFEHSRAKGNALLSAYQSATSGMVKKMAKGCDWSQDVERLIREAGFTKVTWGPFEEAGGLLEALEVQK